MTRTQAAAHIRTARERFRARVTGVKWWYRNEIAAAAKALARELEPLEFDKAVALRELGELLEVAPEHRDPPVQGPPSSRRPPPLERLLTPSQLGDVRAADLEGDEFLQERRQRFRRPT